MQCLEQCGPQAISGGSRMWLPLHSRWLRTQSCHMISPEGKLELIRRCMAKGMGALMPQVEVPLGPDGQPFVAGWFCVRHFPKAGR